MKSLLTVLLLSVVALADQGTVIECHQIHTPFTGTRATVQVGSVVYQLAHGGDKYLKPGNTVEVDVKNKHHIYVNGESWFVQKTKAANELVHAKPAEAESK